MLEYASINNKVHACILHASTMKSVVDVALEK
jgi:hypothetical protein